MKMFRPIVVFLTIALLAGACSDRVPQKQMIALLTDFYLYGELPNELKGSLRDSVSLTRSLLEKHGVEQERFEATVRYYAAHPKEMKRLYEQLDSLLKDRIALLRQAVEEKERAQNQWMGLDSLLIDSLQTPERIAFHIPIDTVGNFTMRLTATVFENDSTQQPEMVGYFLTKIRKGARDTVNRKTVALTRSGTAQTYSLAFSTLDTNVNAFEGYWLYVGGDDTVPKRQHAALHQIRLLFNNDSTQYIASDLLYPAVQSGTKPKKKPRTKPEKPAKKTSPALRQAPEKALRRPDAPFDATRRTEERRVERTDEKQ
jgi:hypothetical protein